jgi:triacylglycerol lipase
VTDAPPARTFAELRALLGPRRDRVYFAEAARVPFRPAAAEFDPGTAWRLAEASTLAYVPDEAFVAAAWRAAGARSVRCFGFEDAAKTEAVLAECESSTALVFRGTEPDDPRDWRTDLDAVFTPWPAGGRVHRGFATALDDRGLFAAVVAAVARAPRPLHLAGHSLGGALAVLAASRLLAEGAAAPETLRVTTFGAPRIGDAAFAATVRCPAFRVVTAADCVPELLPARLGYVHVGAVRRAENGLAPRPEDPPARPWAPFVASDWRGRLREAAQRDLQDWLRPFAAHAPAHYADLLRRVATERPNGTPSR